MVTTSIKKVKVDLPSALAAHTEASNQTASDRFALAAQITKDKPHGLAPEGGEREVLPTRMLSVTATHSFDLSVCVPGAIVRVPLHLIDPNQYSPRHFYKTEEIDKIASSLPDGQDDAAHGYVEGGRIKLIDGGTRFRAAKASDTFFLDVKIEEPPIGALDLYNRARKYNDLRSQPTPVDHALSLVLLLKSGGVKSQRDLMDSVMDLSGKPMSEAQVSTYVRIGRMPEQLLRQMNESPETSTTAVLYAVSELFHGINDGQLGERIDLANQVIAEIKQRDLNKKQVVDLVRAKLEGKKHRQRSTAYPLNISGHKGQIKMFEKRGQLDLSLKGLSEERMSALRHELVKTLESFMTDSDTQSS